MKKRSVLVTGGCGYIGSHVTRQLSEKGYRVVVLDDLSTGTRDSLLHDEVLVEGDVGNEGLLREVFSSFVFDAVLHFAGAIVVPESVAEPIRYYANNTFNTLKLLRACERHDVQRVIFSSTASVYGDTVTAPLAETLTPAPTNPYSRSKLMSEWIIDDVAKASPLKYVVLRYFNVAGADLQARLGQRSAKATHLIKVGCEVLTGKRKEVVVFGDDYPTPDGTGVRDYIHVEDLASAHLAALEYLEEGGENVTLNCGYGRGLSVKQVLAGLREAGGEFPISRGPRRPGDVSSLIADVTKIHRTLRWKPRYDDLSTIVGTALAWERKLAETHAQAQSH